MTFAERVAAVEALGFRPRQAAFLTTVALHSGYCLRRQYAAFVGCKYGKNVCDFVDSLVDRGLARRITFRADRGSIYHLFARRLYAAIGQEDNRNRRHASPPQIARKLMLLDFVIEHSCLDWYATEADKVDLFLNRLGVPDSILPQRTYESKRERCSYGAHTTRYLIQKLPLFVAQNLVHFVCLVVDPEASGIELFVREHAPLLRHLPASSLHAIVPAGIASEPACHVAYERALAAISLATISAADIAWFSATRHVVLEGDLRTLNVTDLKRYRELSRVIGERLDSRSAGRLTVHYLPHRYEQAGSVTI